MPNYVSSMSYADAATPLCGNGNTNSCPIASSCTASVNFTLAPDATPHTWDAYPIYSSNITNATWYWGDGTDTIGLYPSHTYSVAGLYNICVVAIDVNSCNATYCQNDSVYRLSNNSVYSTMIHINVKNTEAGIEQYHTSNNMRVYPNPSTGSFQVIYSGNIDELKISDMLGQTVYETKLNTVNTTLQLKDAGVYFVTITVGTETITKKVIVDK